MKNKKKHNGCKRVSLLNGAIAHKIGSIVAQIEKLTII
ncbi:hypothetical protein ABIB40_001547 [Pedobacter sp. UYP30]